MLKQLITIDKSTIFENPYWTYKLDKYLYPNGSIGDYHYVDSRGATMIVPLTESNEFIMVEQYRYLNNKISIEFPGGGIKIGLSALDNAIAELKEETGYSSNRWNIIGEFNPFNGVTNEICKVFIADQLTKGYADPEESEEINIIKLKEKDIINKIETGEIWDGMTLAAFSIYFLKKKS